MASRKRISGNSKRKKQIQGENMAFSINTNIASLQAQEYLRVGSDFQSKTINRVTSGLRILSSGDDAAGLAIANGIRSDRAVLMQGVRNANDGLSTLQTIDGGINNISQLLDRARTLAAQSSSGTFAGDRNVLDNEFQSVVTEIDRQAQAIGMNSGGKFAQNLNVFVGGGRDSAGATATAAALTNGTATVDLSSSAVDTKSLGLSSYKATGGAVTISTVQGGGATDVDLKFFGAGYDTGVTVSVKNPGTITSVDKLVESINTAIATAASAAGAPAASFKAAGIVATKSSDGTKVEFSSATGAFSITDGTNNAAVAQHILGAAAGVHKIAQGTYQQQLEVAAALGATETQSITVSAVDSTGSLVSTVISLGDAGGDDKAALITKINAQLQTAGGALAKLVAVNDNGAAAGVDSTFTIMGTQSFSVFVGTASDDNGVETVDDTQNTIVNAAVAGSASSVNIKDAANAQAAVNALANAVSNLGLAQGVVGKGQNQFNYAISLASTQLTNLAASESRIRDADLAMEAANLTKAQVLQQAGIAALAQANAATQAVLSLLRG
jgi:flagellin